MTAKILVVDDEESLVRLITYNLEKEGFSTCSTCDGDQAVDLVMQKNPDLILLDLMLPGQNGLEICRQLRQAKIKTPIIILSAKDDEIDKVVGLELGADDYVTKPFSVRELIARVKAVLRRNVTISDSDEKVSRIETGEFALYLERYEVFKGDKLLELTLKEYELLEILLRNRGRVLKREFLLETLWGYPDSVNTRVLDVHISKLREKVEDDPKKPRYIKTIRGLGYKFEEGLHD